MGNCLNGKDSDKAGPRFEAAANDTAAQVPSASVPNGVTPKGDKPVDPDRSTRGLVATPGMFIGKKAEKLSDRYKLLSKIGDGAFGFVRKAVQKDTGIVRAIKTIDKRTVEKGDEKEKLFAEVQVLRKLDHPNIMKLFEFYEDSKYYHLVMELYTGGELFDKIIKENRLDEPTAAMYLKQVLSGITYCHKHNIVHRDLKPENLLLESADPGAMIKIIDFGTSRVFSTEGGRKMHQKLGTPYYVAPEVLRKRYDEKCDVWSCGVILYILLCGSPPFGGQSDNEILQKVLVGKYRMDGPEWKNVDRRAKDLIKQMLTYDPEKRISAEAALQHPWIQEVSRQQKGGAVTSSQMKNALSNLKGFQQSQAMQQAALTFIASQLTSKEERDLLTKAFQELDTNGDGMLSQDEVVKGWKKVFTESDLTDAEIEEIFKAADADGSGSIDYTEFLVATLDRKAMCSKEKLESAFRTFDTDGSGKISSKELAHIFGVGDKMDQQLWEQIIGEVDKNGDGEVDLNEFKQMMVKLLSG
uniref:Calcium-dependent protein kinase 1 n=1 Tax=Chromera velia CCMP2878 TaxID=1169474 RepID=A0A0G4HAB5_9ALVE|mmetsp:Transcript_3444/g.7132  ORF Transcript_3444/g.7132 Transcript_3444/m.7132 type:complete len:526 (+) Transcript_3444:133-1710(+)|eukprot:Cvel_25497.t1-p1 / transcript=Cvel_25497.t1 / gene=Cvel_25497 / organism=Chromera_velia_CCMP2878 / gene_product=Calcium-dependent protein kinase 4, putative / transcript_product=Calcium-dependent protein kinase 4, putative / location=Cvel_scaffold2897:16677-22162(+) / protein_length=525 / sequence_SO=supercontig / SO=protein_coding / is_pseudo=false